MKKRLLILRKELHLTQESFGAKLGVGKTAISKLENGENNLTEAMLKLICSEFSVNEVWLRTGEGDIFQKMNSDDELALLMGKIVGSDNQFIKDTMLALAKLDERDWDFIKQLMDKIKN